MYCPFCGAELPNDAKFCGECGKSFPDTAISNDTQKQEAGKEEKDSTTARSASTPPSYDAAATVHSNTEMAPVGQLRTNRALWKMIVFGILTLGIYNLVIMCGISNDINVIASRYDGRKTMHYALLFFLVAPITLGIAHFVWNHKLANRIGGEMSRRNVPYSLKASDFWLWSVLGALIIVGPFIYIHKLCTSMNKLCEHYNVAG